jgi:hypothetical protein
MPKYITIKSKTKICQKAIWASPREDFKSIKKNGGDPKNNWKSLEILLNFKLFNLILHQRR